MPYAYTRPYVPLNPKSNKHITLTLHLLSGRILSLSETLNTRKPLNISRSTYHPGGYSIYVGGYQVPVNRPPPHYADLTPNNPLFSSVHIQWPLFPVSYQILHTNCKFSRALRSFWEICQFCSNFNVKFANFVLKLHFCSLSDPHFWESTSKKDQIFRSQHRMTPLFNLRKSHTECPYFCSPVRTCTSLSYLNAPPGL